MWNQDEAKEAKTEHREKERETFFHFRMNTVSSSLWQLPHFSNTNGCQCWSACIRSLGVGPITAALSLSFITQFVCTLIRGLALPAHPSTRRHTQAHMYTCLPTDCQHIVFLGKKNTDVYVYVMLSHLHNLLYTYRHTNVIAREYYTTHLHG